MTRPRRKTAARTGDLVLRAVEAAYDLGADDTTWLRHVGGQLRLLMPPTERSWFARVQITPWRRAKLLETAWTGLSPKLVGTITASSAASPPWASMLLFGGAAGYREFLPLLRPSRVDDPATRARKERWAAVAIPAALEAGVLTASWLSALDVDGHGLIVGVFPDAYGSVAARRRRTLAQVSAHVLSALRLRRRLSTRAAVELVSGGAVLDVTGAVLEADGDARARAPRDALRTAARAIDAAKARRDEDDAIDGWRSLVEGRWSLLDTFDTDGRRYFVARPNAPHLPEPRALTVLERSVVAFVARGEATKSIAYTLGLSSSRVDALVASAVRKLGLQSRAQLSLVQAVTR